MGPCLKSEPYLFINALEWSQPHKLPHFQFIPKQRKENNGNSSFCSFRFLPTKTKATHQAFLSQTHYSDKLFTTALGGPVVQSSDWARGADYRAWGRSRWEHIEQCLGQWLRNSSRLQAWSLHDLPCSPCQWHRRPKRRYVERWRCGTRLFASMCGLSSLRLPH